MNTILFARQDIQDPVHAVALRVDQVDTDALQSYLGHHVLKE